MEGHTAATYALVYRFLKQQSQNKAAEAVKKAAKPFVVLHDDIEQKGPPLEDIIKEWRAKENTKSGDAGSSSEDTESSDDLSSDKEDDSDSESDSSSEDTSGSESEDDDTSSDDLDEELSAKELPKKGVERDTSVTLSSAGEISRAVQVKQVEVLAEKKLTKMKDKGSVSDSSDSDGSDSDSSSKSSDAETSSSTSDSSSSSDSSDKEEASENGKAPPNATKSTEEDKSSSGSSSDSQEESNSRPQHKENAHVSKKRKTSESGAAVTTAVSTRSQENSSASHKKAKPAPKGQERFQRVKVQDMTPGLLLDNGYEARGASTNDYGKRAHHDLIVTRGAGFRKEKNKKKRGSYRGGEITMENHSIKFDF